MTGLEVEKYHILEIACLITDQNLSPVSDYLDIVIHQSDEILNNMTDWCKTQHKKAIIHNYYINVIVIHFIII